MTSLHKMMGGTASQERNLAQLSKEIKEKPLIKENLTKFINLF